MALSRTSRRMSSLATIAWASFAGILWHACVSPARAQSPEVDPTTTARWLIDQIHHGHAGTWIVVASVYLGVKGVRGLGGERFPWLRSPAGGAITGALVSLAGGLLSMGVAGKPLDAELVTMTLVAWWGAAGSQSTLSDILSLNFKPKADPAVPVVGNAP